MSFSCDRNSSGVDVISYGPSVGALGVSTTTTETEAGFLIVIVCSVKKMFEKSRRRLSQRQTKRQDEKSF